VRQLFFSAKHEFCVEGHKIMLCDTNRKASISQILLYDTKFCCTALHKFILYDTKFVFYVNRSLAYVSRARLRYIHT
jgi:hypothetical protein